MIILVCGGRDYSNQGHVFEILDAIYNNISKVVTGGATGADSSAVFWARERGVPYAIYKADWASHGKAAGAIRNEEMLKKERPGLVVAFPGGRGTEHMVRIARRDGVPIRLIGWDDVDET